MTKCDRWQLAGAIDRMALRWAESSMDVTQAIGRYGSDEYAKLERARWRRQMALYRLTDRLRSEN